MWARITPAPYINIVFSQFSLNFDQLSLNPIDNFQILEDGATHTKLIETMKKEFRLLRIVWRQIYDQVSILPFFSSLWSFVAAQTSKSVWLAASSVYLHSFTLWNNSQILDNSEKLPWNKHSSLFCSFVVDEEENIWNVDIRSPESMSSTCLLWG